MKRRHLTEAGKLIVRWQRMPHPEHTGPALFDCERRQLAGLIAQALASAEERGAKR